MPRRTRIVRPLLLGALLACAPAAGRTAGQPASARFPPQFTRAEVFLSALRANPQPPVARRRVSGLTVPHHLLAADLMVRGFRIAEGQRYRKIVVLLPDHYKRARRPFATTRRSFDTVFGPVAVSAADVELLLKNRELVEDSALFAREHAIGALLPFLRHFFPDTPVVPIAIAISSTREQWERLVADLEGVVTADTLIVQSTDFSHYLPLGEALVRDQQVLNVLAANDLDAVARLQQPAHLDSRGAQYVQMRLQESHFRARPLAVLHANSQDYSKMSESRTTSYIVQVYAPPDPSLAVDPSDPAAAQMFCFAGDTFFGRDVLRMLSRPGVGERVRGEMRARLGACPLIVNLEGVLVDEVPEGLGPMRLAMPSALALDWLRALNVVAASVANNHARDLGDAAREEMARRLEEAGIRVLRHGRVEDLGPLRVVALTDRDESAHPRGQRISADDLDGIARSPAAPPLVAFLHWGTEWETAPGARELALADALRERAVSLIVGAHPHRASSGVVALAGGEAQLAYSLGNFVFDQTGERATGAVLELRVFPHGTFFTRLIPIPNFYDRMRRAN